LEMASEVSENFCPSAALSITSNICPVPGLNLGLQIEQPDTKGDKCRIFTYFLTAKSEVNLSYNRPWRPIGL
jgi:hypothetical protein